MRRSRNWMMITWPGLPHLWNRGSWAGLALALGFTALVCVVLIGWLIWTAWLPLNVRIAGAGLAFVVWVVSAIFQYQSTDFVNSQTVVRARTETKGTKGVAFGHLDHGIDEKVGDRRKSSESDALFCRAQMQYLQGDWAGAERTLEEILSMNRRDVEASLLLATLCRHSSRFDEAHQHLDRLERLEAAGGWKYEIQTERERSSAKIDQNTAETLTSTTEPIYPTVAEKETICIPFTGKKNETVGDLEEGTVNPSEFDTTDKTDAA